MEVNNRGFTRYAIMYQAVIWGLSAYLSLTISLSTKVYAQARKGPSQTVKAIEVTGQRKIEKEAILARLKSKVGETYSKDKASEDLKSLFNTGFFNDVQILKDSHAGGVKLIYKIVEKPTVAEIKINGSSEVKSEEIEEALGIKNFEILSMGKVREGTERILKLYEDKGYFLTRVEPKVEAVTEGETVRLVIDITENEKVKVKKITFLGNTKLKDGFLKSRMATQEMGFFSFFSNSGQYKQDAFDRDSQILRFIYFNEGYVQVRIDRPQVYVTPDKKSIYITFRIDEGEQFQVGEVNFAGDLLFPREELASDLQISQREVFSWEVLQKDLSVLQAKYGDLGYAFANVIPRTRINEQDKKVDITFEFDKGSKVYFGRFNMVGNSKTRDKVIRRELKIKEGELYNETRRRESLENIQRLGFFEEVTFKTSTPLDKPDILNIDILVKERNTGSIQLGAGYGSATGFTLQGSVNQSNFLGKGQKLGASLNISRDGSYYSFSFTEPYFKDTDWSLGFEVYQSISSRFEYNEKKTGGAFQFGHPLGEHLAGYMRYKLDKTDLTPVYDINGDEITDRDVFPLDTASGLTSSISGILEYDKRNDRFSPSKGFFARASLEYAGLGGDLKYTKGSTTFRYFKKVFWEVVWRNNLSYSFIGSHDANVEPPFNELFLLGGPYSLRGYRFFRVGKQVFSNKTYTDPDVVARYPDPDERYQASLKPFGGKKQLLYQTELEFPLIAEAGIKGVAFFDIGQAEDEITEENFYSDIGFGFRWFSPIGPLRFEWGFPLKKIESSPDPVVFEFSIGSPF